jgi:hypothetical protein
LFARSPQRDLREFLRPHLGEQHPEFFAAFLSPQIDAKSFDYIAVRFANDNFSQDDITARILITSVL